MLRLALYLLIGMTSPTWAETSLTRAFADWVAAEEMAPAALVVLDDGGNIMAEVGNTQEPRLLASLSKTVAGQCALFAMQQRLIRADDTLAKLLDLPAPHGAVTVAQLLTHTAGFGRDATQGDWSLRKSQRRVAQLLARIPEREPNRRGAYSYSNETYLVLEAALRRALGIDDVAEWCGAHAPALKPLGSLGVAEPVEALGFAGGLEMSAADLARLFQRMHVEDHWPQVQVSNGVRYGPGVVLRERDTGLALFHTGVLCLLFGPDTVAVGARLGNGAAFGVIAQGCADTGQLRALQALIVRHLE